jgi:carboxymethylenebutenolidase
MGSMVTFQGGGGTHDGYLVPAPSGKGPGVIVLQEWWGLVPHIKAVADRFSAAGFTALAPDLYGGQTAGGPDDAGRLMMALEIGETEKVLRGAVQALLAQPACGSSKVGVVGFCMGGQLALLAGTLNPKVGAVVDFYGIHPKVTPDYAKLQAPVLGIFAEKDTFVNADAVRRLEEDLKAVGKRITLRTFKGVDHAFFNDTRSEVYDEGSAREAWDITIAFFREHLR